MTRGSSNQDKSRNHFAVQRCARLRVDENYIDRNNARWSSIRVNMWWVDSKKQEEFFDIYIYIYIYICMALSGTQIPVYDSAWKASLSPMGTKILEIKSAIFQFSCVNLEVCSKADYESKSYRNCVADIIGWCQSGDYWTSINYNNESDTPSITTVRPFLGPVPRCVGFFW